uniref:Uncharacterized protein n=1 Tax=Arundo donax TaxID=35708 RepID=A0A0A9H1Z0_ARUDO
MMQSWIPSIIITLSIALINLIHMPCKRLRSILFESMTSHILPMQCIMIVCAVP